MKALNEVKGRRLLHSAKGLAQGAWNNTQMCCVVSLIRDALLQALFLPLAILIMPVIKIVQNLY